MPPATATARRRGPDLADVKARQRSRWGSGDYAVIAATLPIVAESLCEAVALRAGGHGRVLDVATGLARHHRGGPGLVVPGEHLEVVVTRS